MNYANYISEILIPQINDNLPTVIDLFAGCGGLSLGFEANGFNTIGYEMDLDATATYNNNLKGKCINKKLGLGEIYPEAGIVIGGPPCQPFSVRGKQKGLNDQRNGFPIFLDAVKKVNPELCLFENVRGMFYKNRAYLDGILDELCSLGYNVYYKLLNAKNFEVPQNRERLIVVAAKKKFAYPRESILRFTAGDAVNDIKDIPADQNLFLTKSMDLYISKYEKASSCVTPRDLHLYKPARTLTCRNLAGATSDMHRIAFNDGRRRMLTIREAARLQSFPDWFQFSGKLSSQYKQIGNAVAPMFSYKIAEQIKNYMIFDGIKHESTRYLQQMELF